MSKKIKNILNRIVAIVVAIMCMLSPIPVFAVDGAPTIDTSKKGSIEVYKYNLTDAKKAGIDTNQWTANGEADSDLQNTMKSYAIKDVEFTYLKVADIQTKSENGNIDVVYNIPTELATILGLSGKTEYTSTEINKALSDALTQNSSGTKSSLTEYIKNGQKITTDANGHAKAENLELGLYLMVETKFPNNISMAVNPFFVSVPMTKSDGSEWFYDITVYPKNETDKPTVDKLVRQDTNKDSTYNKTANGSIGDKMDYIFVSRLPKIDAGSTATYLKTYLFEDIASAGLTYNKDAKVYFYDNEVDAKKNDTSKAISSSTWDHGSSYFTEEYTSNSDGTTKMTITPTTTGYSAINPAMSEKYMVISYSVTINEKAVLGDKGNENEVTLKWNRTPSSTLETETSKAKVFTFGLNITKKFEGTKEYDFTKVQFILQNKTDGHYVKATGTNGVYTVNGKAATKDDATVFSPSSTGSLVINGIEADEYQLTEVKTSDGYSLLKEPIDITITKDGDTTASAIVDNKNVSMSVSGDSANARVDLTVVNRANFTLPITGGAGTLLFTLGGCLLALVGIIIITDKKKAR